MKHRRLPRVICACLLAAAAGTNGCDQKHPDPVPTPPPPVVVARPVEREVTDYQVFTARTQAVQSVDVKPRVTGYLTRIAFKDGDEVKKGDVLFEIDDRPYKADLDKALAAVETQKAALVKAQAEYDIGLDVQAQNPGAISKFEITRRLGARDEAAGALKNATAAADRAKLNYDWCKVTAPISGRANRHFVDVGNLVAQDVTTLTNIVSLRPMWAYFDVDENSAERYQALVKEGKVKSARASEIPVQMGLGADQGFPIRGVVDFVSNQLDPTTGSIRLRAVFENKDSRLTAGMFGRVRVPSSAPHKALLVTDRAVGTDQGQKFILVVNEKNEVERRPVEVGQMHNGLREVMRTRRALETGPQGQEVVKEVEALTPSDRVIVDGLQRARPGAAVNPKLVDMLTLSRR